MTKSSNYLQPWIIDRQDPILQKFFNQNMVDYKKFNEKFQNNKELYITLISKNFKNQQPNFIKIIQNLSLEDFFTAFTQYLFHHNDYVDARFNKHLIDYVYERYNQTQNKENFFNHFKKFLENYYFVNNKNENIINYISEWLLLFKLFNDLEDKKLAKIVLEQFSQHHDLENHFTNSFIEDILLLKKYNILQFNTEYDWQAFIFHFHDFDNHFLKNIDFSFDYQKYVEHKDLIKPQNLDFIFKIKLLDDEFFNKQDLLLILLDLHDKESIKNNNNYILNVFLPKLLNKMYNANNENHLHEFLKHMADTEKKSYIEFIKKAFFYLPTFFDSFAFEEFYKYKEPELLAKNFIVFSFFVENYCENFEKQHFQESKDFILNYFEDVIVFSKTDLVKNYYEKNLLEKNIKQDTTQDHKTTNKFKI